MVGAALVLALAARTAAAQVCPATPPACNDATAIVNPVYILAADTQVPALHALGKLLRAQSTPITIVYIPNGSCTNLANLYATPPKYTAGTGGGPYYVPADPTFDPTVKTACACVPQAGIAPDMAISIVFPDNVDCPTAPAKPAGIGVSVGPVQGMTFVVPYDTATNAGSSQKAITAEEAYLVMGLGAANGMVPPWTDPTFIYGRPASKGTQISIGSNIQVPASKWKLLADANHQIDQSSAMAATIAALATDPNAEKALGILGVEIYDKAANRAKMHSLAFRAYKQEHAFWPDSTPTGFDKQNIRDGHYLLWSYVQYLTPVTAGGTAVNPNAQTIIDMFVGNPVTPNPVFEPLDTVIKAGLVPVCAMKVQRMSEGGDLSLYSSTEPCGCYFDKTVPNGTTACTPCSAGTPCATGMCRRGYCEAK
jgi:hypothetical protein